MSDRTVSFANDVLPKFRSGDIRCMQRFDVMLDDYDYMSDPKGNEDYTDHANARRVFCHLIPNGCQPRMPMHGPYWSEDDLALYLKWMDDGFQP